MTKKPIEYLENTENLSGNKIIVTGATGGIGSETALSLARKGAQVYIHGRNNRKGRELKQKLNEENGKENIFLEADYKNPKSIHRMVSKIKKQTDRIDGLINNAAGYFRGIKKAENGLELTYTVNHLAPALLTKKTIPLLKKTRKPRIINVSSEAHRQINKLELNEIHNPENGWKAYSRSKLYNILYTKKLARKYKDKIITKSIHPGAVAGTKLFRNLPTPLNKITQIPKKIPLPFITQPPEAAATIINAYIDTETPTGTYYKKFSPTKPSKTAQKKENQEKLWKKTQKHLRNQ